MTDPDALMAQGNKKLQGGGFWSSLFGGAKYDDAREIFVQAGNQYKRKNNWLKASEAFQRAAYCGQKANNPDDEASGYREAGDSLKKLGINDAMEMYLKTVAIYKDTSKFSQAAKLLKSMAESREQDSLRTDEERKEIADLYGQAAEMFDLDEFGKTQYAACMLKVAELRAYSKTPADYQSCIKIYEEQASKALQNTLLQHSAKEYLLKAGILQLCLEDSVTASIAKDKYFALDPRFETSREGQLFAGLCDAVEAGNKDAFEEKLFEYDQISKLDAWKTTFLIIVKEQFDGCAGGDAEDDDDLT